MMLSSDRNHIPYPVAASNPSLKMYSPATMPPTAVYMGTLGAEMLPSAAYKVISSAGMLP